MVIRYHNNNNYANKIDLTPIPNSKRLCGEKIPNYRSLTLNSV